MLLPRSAYYSGSCKKETSIVGENSWKGVYVLGLVLGSQRHVNMNTGRNTNIDTNTDMNDVRECIISFNTTTDISRGIHDNISYNTTAHAISKNEAKTSCTTGKIIMRIVVYHDFQLTNANTYIIRINTDTDTNTYGSVKCMYLYRICRLKHVFGFCSSTPASEFVVVLIFILICLCLHSCSYLCVGMHLCSHSDTLHIRVLTGSLMSISARDFCFQIEIAGLSLKILVLMQEGLWSLALPGLANWLHGLIKGFLRGLFWSSWLSKPGVHLSKLR